MVVQSAVARPIRAGVFSSMARAERAIDALLDAGFPPESVTVVCSRGEQRDHFRAYLRQDPAGRAAPPAAVAGGAVGAALAGIIVLSAAAVAASPLLVAVGGASIWTGGIVGGLVGAMMTRGVDQELANYYEQAVQHGKMLVAVEGSGRDPEAQLARAERILSEVGAEPIALAEG